LAVPSVAVDESVVAGAAAGAVDLGAGGAGGAGAAAAATGAVCFGSIVDACFVVVGPPLLLLLLLPAAVASVTMMFDIGLAYSLSLLALERIGRRRKGGSTVA